MSVESRVVSTRKTLFCRLPEKHLSFSCGQPACILRVICSSGRFSTSTTHQAGRESIRFGCVQCESGTKGMQGDRDGSHLEAAEGRFSVDFARRPFVGRRISGDSSEKEHDFQIVPFRDGRRPGFALITKAAATVLVNGTPVAGNLRRLRHKDELLTGSQRMFFSAETQPSIETYEPAETSRPIRCPVCRGELRPGDSIVRCPGCQRAYHQAADVGEATAKCCWTYAAECRFCQHATSMSGRPSWRPEEECEA